MTLTTVTFTVTTTGFSTTPKVALDWTAFSPAGSFDTWKVYRRVNGTTPWQFLKSIPDVNSNGYDDWTAPSGFAVQYAVTQSSTTPDVSAQVASTATGTLSNPYYWFVVPTLIALNMKLYSVTSDQFKDEVEIEAVNLLGRGRRVEYGTDFGVSGTLEVHLTDQTGLTARTQLQMLRDIRDTSQTVYMRNPFGDGFPVSLTSLDIDRVAGIGASEFVDVSIEYQEVTEA